MEIHAGTQDVLSEDPVFLRLFHSHTQTLNGKTILRSYVNISVLRADSVGGDAHSLDHLVGIAFHYGAVHERARVSLVAVTYDVTYFFFLAGNLGPFTPGGEARAAASAKAGFRHFVDHVLGSHLEKRLCKRLETSHSNVFVNGFRVDLTAVLQNDPGLLIQKWNIV